MKVEKLAKNREKGQNCYPLSPERRRESPKFGATWTNWTTFRETFTKVSKQPEVDVAPKFQEKLRWFQLGCHTVTTMPIDNEESLCDGSLR